MPLGVRQPNPALPVRAPSFQARPIEAKPPAEQVEREPEAENVVARARRGSYKMACRHGMAHPICLEASQAQTGFARRIGGTPRLGSRVLLSVHSQVFAGKARTHG
jgi:hypothetical protein